MILRCTAKMLTLLGARATALPDLPPSDDDDWYLNLLWIERRKCLLLTHAGTLFPVFVADIRKADLRPIGPYVVSLIEEHLRSELLAADTLGRLDPDDVHLAKTASRSILGVMNDTALHARYRIEAMGGIDRSDTFFLNRFLRRALHNRAGDYVHSFVDLLHCLTRDSPDQGPDQQRLERAAWPDGRRKSARSVGRSRLS